MGTKFSLSLLTATILLAASPAFAQDIRKPEGRVPADVVLLPAESAVEEVPDIELIADDELEELRGGESMVIGNQTLVAITSGNVISGDYTAGSVSLSDFALSNFNGIGNLLINTGGQVSLQTGMNLIINVGE